MKQLILIAAILLVSLFVNGQSLNNTKFDGYRGIWFELNQKYEYGDKYSGALGTYTAKHVPLAIYSPQADKTFFVYGGTTAENERHLLCMIGEFDHKTGLVSKPTVVYVRQLYFESSLDGVNWTDDRLLAAIPGKEGKRSGHYQTSACFNGEKVGTFFNRHPDGNVDKRTDIYYIETSDLGQTWTDVQGNPLEIPLLKRDSPAQVIDYQSQGKNVYLKDMDFDSEGNPVAL